MICYMYMYTVYIYTYLFIHYNLFIYNVKEIYFFHEVYRADVQRNLLHPIPNFCRSGPLFQKKEKNLWAACCSGEGTAEEVKR